VTITQIEIRFKTKVSHKHMVVIYHRNTPLPKVRKGLDRYTPRDERRPAAAWSPATVAAWVGLAGDGEVGSLASSLRRRTDAWWPTRLPGGPTSSGGSVCSLFRSFIFTNFFEHLSKVWFIIFFEKTFFLSFWSFPQTLGFQKFSQTFFVDKLFFNDLSVQF
jgi:hypothetical protein